ncbi:MAG: hypothetical protein HOC23_13890 [Halieaceae bacterium]|jgi:hypothetical protein|nr:hypothetical protein [Halieaceae bacterium]
MKPLTKYISDIGLAMACDHQSALYRSTASGKKCELDITFNADDFGPFSDGDTVYLHGHALQDFVNCYWAKIQENGIRISLVTTHHACCMPLEFSATRGFDYLGLLRSSNLTHWFTESCDLPAHPKMTSIPIGINYISLATVTRHIRGEGPVSQPMVSQPITPPLTRPHSAFGGRTPYEIAGEKLQ